MASRLETLVHGHRAVVADVSHQLRTPLAALRLRFDLLAQDADPATAAELAGALEEFARLSRLVDGLLAVAKAEHAMPRPVPVDVREVVRERVVSWQPVADDRGVSLAADVTGAVIAAIGEGQLEQILDNLIANALDATAAGDHVTVSAEVTLVEPGPPGSAEVARGRGVPGRGVVSARGAPAKAVSGRGAPAKGAPASGAPATDVSGRGAPAMGAPAGGAPVGDESAEGSPTWAGSGRGAAVGSESAEESHTRTGSARGLSARAGSARGGDGSRVRVVVADDGPGMSPTDRARAFGRFTTASPGGTGLGLAIVYRLVSANGGTATLNETPGGGLSVTFEFPAAPALAGR
jgi:signal transduction histidine kinase